MSLALSTSCQLKNGLFACGSEQTGICQYCARSFCQRHGVVLDDGQQICARKVCVAKRDDVARHLVFKELVRDRNLARACGVVTCVTELGGQCTRCLGLFCAGHVRGREELVLENRVRVPRIATLCQHCWSRRPLWVRQ